MKNIILILILSALTIGCKLTKEERRMNRATKKLEKLVDQFPELERVDTLLFPVVYTTERQRIDTVVHLEQDTIYLQKENLTVTIYRTGDSLRISAQCDTIIITDTLRVPVKTVQPVEYRATAKKSMRDYFGMLVIAVIFFIFGVIVRSVWKS